MALEAERGADGLIRHVQKVLGKSSQAAGFASLLYGRKGLAGLGGLPPDRLADDARQALAFIAAKPKGRHKVRVRRVAAGGNGGLPESALIEIVNDDMPFLVDSVLGELQTRGPAGRLLLHPIFKTRRDKAGHLQDLGRVGDGALSDGQQESYIVVHIKALPEAEARELTATLSTILQEVRLVVADWQP